MKPTWAFLSQNEQNSNEEKLKWTKIKTTLIKLFYASPPQNFPPKDGLAPLVI